MDAGRFDFAEKYPHVDRRSLVLLGAPLVAAALMTLLLPLDFPLLIWIDRCGLILMAVNILLFLHTPFEIPFRTYVLAQYLIFLVGALLPNDTGGCSGHAYPRFFFLWILKIVRNAYLHMPDVVRDFTLLLVASAFFLELHLFAGYFRARELAEAELFDDEWVDEDGD